MTPNPDVQAGSVWKDCDVRNRDRYVRVERTDEQYAYCTEGYMRDRESRGNRARMFQAYHGAKVGGVRLLLRRMKPTSTGWMQWSER